MINLYLISQDENQGYDTYDSAVVAAESEDAARQIHPSDGWDCAFGTWCKTPEAVTVVFIGTAAPHVLPGIVVSSFNAG